MSDSAYDVYLVPAGSEVAEESRIVSPVTGDDVELTDAGVWLSREGGRNFFPYGQVRTIREHEGD